MSHPEDVTLIHSTGTDGEVVYWQDASSGRAHKKIRTAAGLVPYGGEQDNLDQAGRGSVISIEALSRLEPDALCNRCFAASEPEDAA